MDRRHPDRADVSLTGREDGTTMLEATMVLALTARELADMRAAVRAHRRAINAAADRGETLVFRAARLALLAIKLTDAADVLDTADYANDPEIAPERATAPV